MIVLPGIVAIAKIYESTNSIVYRGLRERDGELVILKLLGQDYPNPVELARYQQEYELLRHLNLKGVIKVYDLYRYQNTIAIVFEDFGGESLKSLLKKRQFSPLEFLAIAMRISEILSDIHQLEIVHKDINPANIVLNDRTGELKIIDFGIATQLSKEDLTLKNPHAIEGTLNYMSPEQTGRMNRSLDYRTDFYSLGVTFYELLTNRLPFVSNDPLELIHAHIAKQPIAPHELNSEIPLVLSEIIMKLLAKTAEERYQSAYGIKLDLENCLNQFQDRGAIANFTIGFHDICDRFQIPQKLYGRERQIQRLLESFESVSKGETELLLVSGYSGIGKTSLVREVYKPIVKRRGYFISGKCDQFQRHIPYSALIKALQQLIGQLLAETETDLQVWRDKILVAVGNNGQIVIDAIPEVELIVGKQSPVLDLPPNEAQNRFNLVFKNFIRIFCQKKHPLVIFLDDLQWSDLATIALIKEILIDTNSHYLLLIGAYRDNEVNTSHVLKLAITELQQEGAIVNEISLAPLQLDCVNRLIADTLTVSNETVSPLAKLVFKKTQGNPFFVNEFLKSLYSDRLLYFTPYHCCLNGSVGVGGWEWDIESIQSRNITDNVVDLLIAKIQKLPEKTQSILKLAACLGDRFDLKTIAIVACKSQKETANKLFPATQSGLILSVTNNDRLVRSMRDEDEFNVIYKFAHDRIQQAAYSLIAESDKPIVHLQIGRLLLDSIPLQQREEKIFELVNHFNFGIELLDDRQQRDESIQLNLLAAKKAKTSAAYQPALAYINYALMLLPADAWERQYDATLTIYTEAAEIAYLCGNRDEMERAIAIVRQQAKTILDRVKVDATAISCYVACNRMAEAIDLALKVLRQLGVTIPERPDRNDLAIALQETQHLMQGRKPADLDALPPMTAAISLAAIRILSSTTAAAYMAFPALYPLLVFKMVGLLATNGNMALSSYIYASYGLILCGIIGDIEGGYEFGQLALTLLSQREYGRFSAKTLFMTHHFIVHWQDHINTTLSPLQTAYLSALENGDLEYIGYTGFTYCLHSYLLGKELFALETTMAKYSDVLHNFKQQTAHKYMQIFRQAVLNLIEETEEPCRLIGEYYDEKTILPLQQRASNHTTIVYVFINKLILCYLFDSFDRAVENADIAGQYLDGVIGNPIIPIFYFYDSLARLATFADASEGERQRICDRVNDNQAKLQQWESHAPTNHSHRVALVAAERHRIAGETITAMEKYDRAIELARDNDYINEEAIACELAAKFYLQIGRIKIARTYMQDARYCYLRWGATAKVKDLETRYPHLLQQIAVPSRTTTISQSTHRQTSNSGSLDLTTVMKAAQTLSDEIVLEKLLKKLMQTIIENAGAQRGYLILQNRGKWAIEAVGSVDSDEVVMPQSIPIDSKNVVGNFPIAILNYVIRTKNNVVLSDATREGKFTQNRYVKQHQTKSVLCTPLIHQGKLIGVVYLENNRVSGAFIAERLEILQLLCSQAAISLENARLYGEIAEYAQTLEQKVVERTAELEKANQELHRLATLDGLTQVANRRYFDEYLALEWKRSLREKQPLSMILFDVDYFKRYNDRYGHQAGDDCLKQIAVALQYALKRPADLAARYGGEEFAAILPNTEAWGAVAVAKAIREEVNLLQIPHEQSEVGDYVTISIGVATIVPGSERSPEVLIAAADEALYEAKRRGRDRFMLKTLL